MKINQLKAGTLLSYAQMIINVFINLAYTPIMLRLLGKSEYGLYNTIASIMSMLSIFSLGFNSAYVKFYAKYKSEGDEDSVYKLNGLFLLLFSGVGILAAICGIFLTENLEIVFNEGLTENEYKIAKVLMLLLTINLSLTFPMSVFSNIILAQEKFIFLRLAQMGKTIFGPLVTLPLLLMGYRSIAMVSVTVGISLVIDGIYLFYVLAVLKQKFIFKRFEKGLLKQLFSFAYLILIQVIMEQVNTNIDKVLLGRFYGTESVSIYAVGAALFGYYMMISCAVSNVFTPRIYKIVNTGEVNEQKKQLTQLFVKVGRIQFLILMLFSTGILFFGRAFIAWWAGDGYEDSYIVALILVFSYTVDLIQNLGIEIQRAQGKQKFRTILYTAMAIINLVASIILGKAYGAIGCAIGTAISVLVANGLVINIYYYKKCNLNVIEFWKNILCISLGLIIPCVIGILMLKFVEFSSIWLLLGVIIVYACIYCASMWLFGMNKKEKELIKNYFKRKKTNQEEIK